MATFEIIFSLEDDENSRAILKIWLDYFHRLLGEKKSNLAHFKCEDRFLGTSNQAKGNREGVVPSFGKNAVLRDLIAKLLGGIFVKNPHFRYKFMSARSFFSDLYRLSSRKLARFKGVFSSDIGIDLGTANTLVFVRGRGVVLAEPSVVAVDPLTNEVLAVGHKAKAMLGKTPRKIHAVRPMKDGVIADFEIAEGMLKALIRRVSPARSLFRPRILIAVPSGITGVEKRAVEDSALHAGAQEVLLIEEPMAAAIGVDLPVHEPSASMIIDIGGGTTEIAIISLGGIVESRSLRIAGDEFDECIVNYMRRTYNLMVGPRTAEEIKIAIGSAYPLGESELEMEVKGRDQVSGLPVTRRINSVEIRECLGEPIQQIIDSVKLTLEKCPPELAADLVERGMVVAGGGALIRGLGQALNKETGLPVIIAPNPLLAVCLGTGKALEFLDKFKKRRSIVSPG